MATTFAEQRVEVWNASYIPLSKAKLSRAVMLLEKKLAVLEEADEVRIIRTPSGKVMKFPKIIRLVNYLNIPYIAKDRLISRIGIFERDNFTCAYCGLVDPSARKLTWDHIYPQSKGGGDNWENAITACTPCNWKKADKTLEEAGMKLLFPPKKPPQAVYYISSNPRRHKKKF